MFDAEELKKAMEMSEARETIRVEYEDGKVLEHKAKIWTVCGLDPETKTEITWEKMCLVGGDEIVADAVLHVAQLKTVINGICDSLVKTVPDMDTETLDMMVEYSVRKIEKIRKESGNA